MPAAMLGVLVALGLALTTERAHAATVTVNTTIPNSSTDGKCGLVEAVQAVNQASTYRSCTYTPNGQSDKIVFSVTGTHAAGNLTLERDVEIVGSGQSATIITSAAFCTLCSFGKPSGGGQGIILRNLTVQKDTSSSFPVYGVWVNTSSPVDLVMDRVRVTQYNGNGIQLEGDNIFGVIADSTIDNNASGLVSVGGILYVSTSTIRNNTVHGISMHRPGEAQYSFITGSTIRDNRGENGAGIYVEHLGPLSAEFPVLDITGCTFSGNQATGDGGGLLAKAETRVTSSVFDGNTAGGKGGGFSAQDNDSNSFFVTITTTTFKNNLAAQGAGFSNYAPSEAQRLKVSFYQSTFGPGNVATGDGGGIYSQSQIDWAENVTIHGNRAARGAGLFHESGGESHLIHCTVTGNTATQSNGGGGLWLSTGNPKYEFNLIAGNRAGTGITPPINNVFSVNADLHTLYNLVDDVTGEPDLFPTTAQGGTNIVGVNPGLGTFNNYGGPTSVRPLLASSPALDAIPPGVGEVTTIDQRNVFRPTDGNFDGLARSDIGAVEMNTVSTQYEAESLSVAAQSSGTLTTENHASYSAGAGSVKQASLNGYVTYQIGTIQPGTYGVIAWFKKASNAGRFTLAVGSSAGSTTPLGAVQDGYRSTPAWTKVNLGTITLSSAGTRYFKFTSPSKNASSSGYWMYIDAIQLYKTN